MHILQLLQAAVLQGYLLYAPVTRAGAALVRGVRELQLVAHLLPMPACFCR
jgi:hypothetical protein